MSKNWTGNSTWTYEGCIKVKYNGLCLADVPCRTGEYDGLFTPKINLIFPFLLLKIRERKIGDQNVKTCINTLLLK